ncbi:hypothetical protein GQ53DRAFT_744515 [Thozetella sp. PMI_491]|nr:hypothetical protein GQ53DRAFT_744515 [Thozetella sp. PMI_491]
MVLDARRLQGQLQAKADKGPAGSQALISGWALSGVCLVLFRGWQRQWQSALAYNGVPGTGRARTESHSSARPQTEQANLSTWVK